MGGVDFLGSRTESEEMWGDDESGETEGVLVDDEKAKERFRDDDHESEWVGSCGGREEVEMRDGEMGMGKYEGEGEAMLLGGGAEGELLHDESVEEVWLYNEVVALLFCNYGLALYGAREMEVIWMIVKAWYG